ncbi:MAG TPA: toll/interleukin-1 receptor domain-containing protein [Methanocella sp.]|jgi:tetratricopeptide (TPR) repeat protein
MIDQAMARPVRRIFISYGHDELLGLAVRIKDDLAALGHKVWFDADRLGAGTDWEQYIDEGLNWVSEDKNGKVIVLMTPHSVRRPDGFCLNEITRALARNLGIIPVMLVWCEPPLSICRIQWLDMRDCVPLKDHQDQYRTKLLSLAEALNADRLDIEGFHQLLSTKLKPLSFDAEIGYNRDRFTGRQWVFDAIDRWMADDSSSRIFWILGGPGAGKTSIAAYLCSHRPEIVAFHFCHYDNIQKRDPRLAVTSIACQLSTQLPEFEERLKRVDIDQIGDLDAKTLFDLLIVQPLSANFPVPGRKIVVLIDALDEATSGGRNELAGIVAHDFEKGPEWLKLIVTSRPSRDVMGIMQGYRPFRLDGADPRNEQDIQEYLARNLKLAPGPRADAVIDGITRKSGGLFLYASWVLRELERGQLSIDRPDEFPRGLGGIYMKLFQRQFPAKAGWEREIRPALEVISAALEPLAPGQLATILGWDAYRERLFRDATGSLFTFDGTITPFHKSLIEWLTDEGKEDPYFISLAGGHRIISDFAIREYAAGRWTPYLVSHLPEHLLLAGKTDDLQTVLADDAFVSASWESDRFRLMGIWAAVEAGTGLRIRDIYGGISVTANAGNARYLLDVADLLRLTAHYDLALRILDPLAIFCRETRMLKELSECLSQQAWILSLNGETKKSLAASIEHESVCRSLNDVPGLILSLHNQAHAYHDIGDYDHMMINGSEVERLALENGNEQGVERAMNLRAGVLIERDGDYGQALELFRETEKIDRKYGMINRLLASLDNQGECMRQMGRYDEALALFRESERISRKHGERQAQGYSKLNQSTILIARGIPDDALELLEEAVKIFRGINLKVGIAYAEDYIGQALYRKGRHDEAMKHYGESESISRSIGFRLGLQECLGDQALVLQDGGDTEGAIALLTEQERICREIGLTKELSACRERQKSLRDR